MSLVKPDWEHSEDKEWADSFLLSLAGEPTTRTMDIDHWLRQVHDAVVDSGQRAETVFGPPDEAATSFVEGLPDLQRAAVDREGFAPRNFIGSNLVSIGILVTTLATILLFEDGWTLAVRSSQLLILPVGLTAYFAVASSRLLWTSGRLRASAAALIAGIALCVGTVVAANTVLHDSRVLFTMPTALIALAGAAVIVIGWQLPDNFTDVDDRSSNWTPDHWYVRLDGLLRGRYSYPRRIARERVGETRDYLCESAATHPYEEFGAPETYALQLVDNEDNAGRFTMRAARRGWMFVSAVCGVYVIGSVGGNSYDWTVALAAAGTFYFGWRAFGCK